MKMASHDRLDASALVGITVGWALLAGSFLLPDMGLLAIPALTVLVTSLLFIAR